MTEVFDGRTPPADSAMERAVLGACLVTAEAVATCLDILAPEDFATHPYHKALYTAILRLYKRGQPVDLLTVRAELGDDPDLFGLAVDLMGEVVTTAHVEYYARRLADLSQRRAAIGACWAALSECYDLETEDPAAGALGRLLAVQSQRIERAVEVGEVAEVVIARTREAVDARRRYAPTGPAVTTGFEDIDRLLFVGPTDYLVLAARPSTGKTALALQIVAHVASTVPVYMASLEMGRDALTRRLLAGMTGINTYRQRIGALSDDDLERLARAASLLGNLRMFIDERPGLTASQILAAAQVMQAREGLGMVVIDHMSLVSPENRRAGLYEAMTQVSKDIKNMTRRLGVPVLALAQLSRDVEKSDRKPRMSDLRDSGSVEQDADAVLMLHRADRISSFSEATLHIVKQRDGACGDVRLNYSAERTRFEVA